jgi:hypothetical protein
MIRGLRPWVLVLVVAALFVGGVIVLFDQQFAAGNVYPEYSSMRTDRMGARLLYDSLGRMPGMTVERNFSPFAFLPVDGVTLLLLAYDPLEANWGEVPFRRPVEAIAARGNRVVVAMRQRPYTSLTPEDFVNPPDQGSMNIKKKKSENEPPPDPPIHKYWKVKFAFKPVKGNEHPLYFEEAGGWTVLDRAGDRTLAIEKNFGKGSVMLLAESSDFNNDSVVKMERLRQVSLAVGSYHRVIFDEQHLGIEESGTVVGMARRFRLTGLAIGLGLVAALFIWRNASSFPPPAAVRYTDRFSGRTSHAGLLTLLKRHIPQADLAAVCWREWLSVNRREVTPERLKKATGIVDRPGAPLEKAREIQTVLLSKGEL